MLTTYDLISGVMNDGLCVRCDTLEEAVNVLRFFDNNGDGIRKTTIREIMDGTFSDMDHASHYTTVGMATREKDGITLYSRVANRDTIYYDAVRDIVEKGLSFEIPDIISMLA